MSERLDDPRDERLLDALMGTPAARERARAELGGDPAAEAELRALEHSLASAADELRARATSPAREARLVARVLARTTRQDLSWRGDLRLLVDFVRARLRTSPALRVVGALLALNVAAAPAVALWLVLHAPEPRRPITIEIVPPTEDPFATEAPEVDLPEDPIVAAARLREARANEIARERLRLQNLSTRAPAAEPEGTGLVAELLAARSRVLRAALAAEPPRDASPAAPDAVEPLALALWIELQLDRHVLWNDAHAALGPACARLRAALDAGALPAGVEVLASAAVARAVELGILDGPAPAAPGYLENAWFEALGRAGEELGISGEPWNAWASWRGE